MELVTTQLGNIGKQFCHVNQCHRPTARMGRPPDVFDISSGIKKMSKVVFGAQDLSPSITEFGFNKTCQSEMCPTTWVKTSLSMSSSRSDKS